MCRQETAVPHATYRCSIHNVLYWLLLLHLFRLDRCNSGLETQLQLSLGGSDEGLEGSRVALVEADVAAGGVGVTLEDDGLLWCKAEHLTEL